MIQKGDTNQEYLYNLLKAEVECRRQSRLTKYLNAAGFPRRYTADQYHMIIPGCQPTQVAVERTLAALEAIPM